MRSTKLIVPARRRVLALLVMGTFCTSCTLVGAGVGAAIDSAIPGPYANQPELQRAKLHRGDRIRIHQRNGYCTNGKYWGITRPTPTNTELSLILETDDGPTFVRESDIRSVDVEVTGKGWLYGGIVGLIVDAVVVAVVVVALNNTSTAPMHLELGK